jgi:hypothetical protein
MILVTGPLGSLNPRAAGPVTTAVLHFLENERPAVDLVFNPTSIVPPVSRFVAELLTREIRAPFDVLLAIHDTENIAMEKEAFESSLIKIAYVIHSPARGWNKTLKQRLNGFNFVIPANEETHRALTVHAGGKLLGVSTPDEVVAFLVAVAPLPMV